MICKYHRHDGKVPPLFERGENLRYIIALKMIADVNEKGIIEN
jgi:hypothetical protein